MSVDSIWSSLTAHLRERDVLDQVRGLLAWDQQTYQPAKASRARGEQSAVLAGLAHNQFVDPQVDEWLSSLEAMQSSLSVVQAAAVRVLRRSYDRERRVPKRLVEELSRVEASAFEAWLKAKQEQDFSLFAPELGRVVSLVRERAQAIDGDRPAYDVLVEEFDPGTEAASLLPMFSRLRDGLTELIDASRGKEQPPLVDAVFPSQGQLALFRKVAAALGYDFGAGRLDLSEHPFTVAMGNRDVRITTKIDERDLLGGLSGTVHETGHALYEQGLPAEWIGTGLASACSMGMHESQSRFWENYIGGSEAFFTWMAPLIETQFGHTPSPEALFAAYNRIEPDLIRVHADEVTYNLHIIVRVELEIALMQGDLPVADLPEVWNQKYARYLGVTPSNDAEGVLQDVHWASAAIGYFPSYTLGNLYAASFGATVSDSYPELWRDVARGEFSPTLSWLRENVHRHGHLLDAPDRVRAACGERDAVDDLLQYLWARHGPLYGV